MQTKQEALLRLQANPDDLHALAAAGYHAIQEKKYNIALNFYSRFVRMRPEAGAFRKLAEIYHLINKPAVALVYYQRAVELMPSPDPLLEQRLEEFKKGFFSANPRVEEMRQKLFSGTPTPQIQKEWNLYVIAIKACKFAEAAAIGRAQYRRGQLDPRLLATWASATARSNDIHTGLAAALLAVGLNPTDSVALVNLVDLMVQLRQHIPAVDFGIAAVNLAPGQAMTWANLGAAFDIAQRPWESANATRKALAFDPKNVAAWNNLGNAARAFGDMDESLSAYRKAVELDPARSELWSNMLFGELYADDIPPERIAEDHFKFARLFEHRVKTMKLPPGRLDQEKSRLRIGFVSADIRSHPVTYFVEPLWASLDPEKIEIYFYDTFRKPDSTTTRMAHYCKKSTNISEMPDGDAAKLILDDQIDILIDMTGHTAKNRLLLFMRRPAPVQVTWLGHPNTTGLTRIDWRLTDREMDPEGCEYLYSEKLWRLPIHAAYWPLAKHPELRDSPDYAVTDTPALKNGYMTFGSCNNLAKVSQRCFDVWISLLKQNPSAKLMIEAPGLDQSDYRNKLLTRFLDSGITNERLIMHPRKAIMQYKRYADIDIALDPFPYNGGTTTCDLLWMGVPLVSLAGNTCVSRLGVTFLSAVGHPEWIAHTEDEYIGIIGKLASDADALNRIRHGIRPVMQASRLMDGSGFARAFEDAMFDMWQAACGAQQPVEKKTPVSGKKAKRRNG